MRFPIVVTDGFGALPMNSATFRLITTNNNREATLNAEARDRYSGTTPEVIIPLPSSSACPNPRTWTLHPVRRSGPCTAAGMRSYRRSCPACRLSWAAGAGRSGWKMGAISTTGQFGGCGIIRVGINSLMEASPRALSHGQEENEA
jgi:hypothetical protein